MREVRELKTGCDKCGDFIDINNESARITINREILIDGKKHSCKEEYIVCDTCAVQISEFIRNTHCFPVNNRIGITDDTCGKYHD